MTISIIICTYNRAESLNKLLDSLIDQEKKPAFDFEIIVVDNNSKDHTRELVESIFPKFQKKLRYLFEPKQGKTHALNLAIAEAQGDVLAFTDDDCILPKDYLFHIYTAFDKYKDKVDFIGGRVCPNWEGIEKPLWLNEILNQPSEMEGGSPNWMKRFFEGPLVMLDYGNQPLLIEKDKQKTHLFFGANMAVKAPVFEKFGKYRLDKTFSEDTEICQRFLNNGAKGMYIPDIKVFHKIQKNKISPDFFYRWYFSRGEYWDHKDQYQKKFYHPLGIQFSLIAETVSFFFKSLFQSSLSQKIYNRCQGLFNLGLMIKIARQNII